MPAFGQFKFVVIPEESGSRLDSFLSAHLGPFSRAYLAWLIKQGNVCVDGKCQKKPAFKLKPSQVIQGAIPEPSSVDLVPEKEPLDILFEDDALIVINKPAGLVVHPAPGHCCGTLVNRLLYHCPELPGINGEQRPGIVHRLDKDTTGVLVVAKDGFTLQQLARQFKERQVQKTYLALVYGLPAACSGSIELPIGRHASDRKKMATLPSGREASTLWQVKEQYNGLTLLEVNLKTGRTHQIRVHCRAMGHPIVGDALYGQKGALQRIKQHYPDTCRLIKKIERQMLHACKLRLKHPKTGRLLTFKADLPKDMNDLVRKLRAQKTPSLPSDQEGGG